MGKIILEKVSGHAEKRTQKIAVSGRRYGSESGSAFSQLVESHVRRQREP